MLFSQVKKIIILAPIGLVAVGCGYINFNKLSPADSKAISEQSQVLDATTDKNVQTNIDAKSKVDNNIVKDATYDDPNMEVSSSYEKQVQEKKLNDAKKFVEDLRKMRSLNPDSKDYDKEVSCADSRVKYAYLLQEQAKKYLKEYYSFRKDSSLYFSWYSLEDSNFVLSLIADCSDKKNRHYYAMQNMLEQNKEIEKIIAINNRDDNYSRFQELFLDDYHKIFPRDIN